MTAFRGGEPYVVSAAMLLPLHHTRLALEPVTPLTDPVAVELMARIDAVGPSVVPDATEIGEYHGELIEACADDWLRSYFFAFMRLCAQQIAVTTPYRELRGAGLPPAAHQPGPRHPTALVLRTGPRRTGTPPRIPPPLGSPHAQGPAVVPQEGVHKIIWRGPVHQGPADAPLLTGERVNALVH